MTAQEFVDMIYPYVLKYAPQYDIKVVSPIIAQAVIESNSGNSGLAKYNNFFGMKCGSSWKGASVNMKTREEYKIGELTNIRDNFRAYNSVEEGVKGYFEFIQYKRYANLKGETDPVKYLEKIKADGYATSSTYVQTVMNTVNKLGLTKYDSMIGKETVTMDIKSMLIPGVSVVNGELIISAKNLDSVRGIVSQLEALAKDAEAIMEVLKCLT